MTIISQLRCTTVTIVFALMAVAALTMPATAQSKKSAGAVGLNSFAAVQAPEAATEACYAATPARAEACAMRKCRAKAGKGACFAVTLCAPGRWAGIMGVSVGEISFADVLCGAPTEAALIAGLKSYCEGHLPQMKQCGIAEIWGPDGTKKTVSVSWSPADFKK
jgi:hypothetical protein